MATMFISIKRFADLYYDLINPKDFFLDILDLKEFISVAPVKSLKENENMIKALDSLLQVCEKEELYEYCILVKNKIDEFKVYNVKLQKK